MLTIDLNGAQALLGLMKDIQDGRDPDESVMEAVLATNAFFVDFYSGWEGCDRETIRQVIHHFYQPEKVPAGALPQRLAEGFREAAEKGDLMRSRMAWLGTIDASDIAERVLAFLPDGTPLDSIIHITVDLFNSAFVCQNEMGVSLLHGATDRQAFEKAVMHELHHVGFHFWSDRDDDRVRLLRGETGRAVAVMHIQNLLMEGMANYYCAPESVFRESSDTAVLKDTDPYQARLTRLQREEKTLFAQAEDILTLCLKPDAEYEACLEAFNTIALDMEDMMLPAGHYLGARMVQTLAQVYPRERILEYVKRLQEFLPSYNEAARKSGGFVFSEPLVEQFNQLWVSER